MQIEAARTSSTLAKRRELSGLRCRQHPARHAHGVLQGRVLLEHRDVVGVGEEEQVADLFKSMSAPGRSPNRSNASIERSARAMLISSENCSRTPPADFDVDPHDNWSASSSNTSVTPASARWNAALAPITPPPMITTSARSGRDRSKRHTVSECDRSARSDPTRRRHHHASLCGVVRPSCAFRSWPTSIAATSPSSARPSMAASASVPGPVSAPWPFARRHERSARSTTRSSTFNPSPTCSLPTPATSPATRIRFAESLAAIEDEGERAARPGGRPATQSTG